MKEVKKEKTTTQIYYEYEAIDGTIFDTEDECKKYENSAKCVLRAKVKKLIVTKEHNAWTLLGGSDDSAIVGFKFNNEDDIQAFIQHYCLQYGSYYTREENTSELQKIYDQCNEAQNKDDILIVGINLDEDYYIINTRNKLIENLKNIDKDES